MINLKANDREITGRKVKFLRAEGKLPANIYGRDVKSQAIEIDAKEFREVFKKAGETTIVEIALGKETKPALIHNVQLHPATDEILHVDFLQVNLKEKVTAQIPVELVGESPAEKNGIGTAVLLLQEVEVEALPTDLPEKFEIDATQLVEVDQAVKVSDLKYDKNKVEVKAEAESIVAKVEPPQKEEEVLPTPVEDEAAEGEQTAEGGTEAQATEGQEEKPQAEGESQA